MLHNISRQRVFDSDDDLDHLVKVDRLQSERLENPGERALRVVGENYDLETAGEQSLVENVLLQEIRQWLLLLLLGVQDGLEELVVKDDAHLEPQSSERFVRPGVLVGRRGILLTKLVAHLFHPLDHGLRGVLFTAGEQLEEAIAGLSRSLRGTPE